MGPGKGQREDDGRIFAPAWMMRKRETALKSARRATFAAAWSNLGLLHCGPLRPLAEPSLRLAGASRRPWLRISFIPS
jgi:hypothetical protein